jgi:hypothetical protein
VLKAVDHLVLVTSELDALRAVSPKLVSSGPPASGQGASAPPPAPDKLITTLEEMSKIYGAMEEEFKRYLALNFEGSASADERMLLQGLAAGEARTRLGELRGRSGKITAVYERHLRPWFKSVLTKDELASVDDLFRRHLHEFDGDMIQAIKELAGWLKEQASDTLELVNRGKFDAANKGIIAAHREVLPARQKIREAFDVLGELQSEFIVMSD